MAFLDNGSAHNGIMEWWWQRITAVYITIFTIPLIGLLKGLGPEDYDWMLRHLSSPFWKAVTITYVVAVVVHGYIGLRIVVEDYVPIKTIRFPLISLINLVVAVMTLWGIIVIIKIGL